MKNLQYYSLFDGAHHRAFVYLRLYMCNYSNVNGIQRSPALLISYVYICSLAVPILVCFCTCDCMHVFILIYTGFKCLFNKYIHTYMHAYIHTYIHTCMHACIHTYIHACMHAYIHTYIHTCLLLLISMLWHRQAIFESKGDKLSSSAEGRIRTQGLRYLFTNRLNACWQTDWAIDDQAKNLNSTARPYDQQAFSPLDLTASWLSHLALAIYMFVVVNFDALAQTSDIRI